MQAGPSPSGSGFQQEGIERGAELLGTGFVDLATYSMLQPDWAGEPDR